MAENGGRRENRKMMAGVTRHKIIDSRKWRCGIALSGVACERRKYFSKIKQWQ